MIDAWRELVPSSPMRRWRNKAGPGLSSRISSPINSSGAASSTSSSVARTMSSPRFTALAQPRKRGAGGPAKDIGSSAAPLPMYANCWIDLPPGSNMIVLPSLHPAVASERGGMHSQQQSSHQPVNKDAGTGWMF